MLRSCEACQRSFLQRGVLKMMVLFWVAKILWGHYCNGNPKKDHSFDNLQVPHKQHFNKLNVEALQELAKSGSARLAVHMLEHDLGCKP